MAWRLLLVLFLASAGAGQARAEMMALLVGVSAYPNLPEHKQLTGPRNDVLRMRQVLVSRGFAPRRIEVLADGIADAALPTRANVLASLDRLASLAKPGDIVYLHFSGHGSLQPALELGARPDAGSATRKPAVEPIFLPRDVAGWDGDRRVVAQALRASELRAAADRIAARGAFLWAVFDACHSARLVRGGDDVNLRERQVLPAELGVPTEALGGLPDTAAHGDERFRASAPAARTSPSAGPGATVYMYAAQAHEASAEMRLPAGQRDARLHGLFSFVIAKAIERARPMTYRQLAQYVMAEYRSMADAWATPLFAGTGLDAFVLGQMQPREMQWPLQWDGARAVLPAGSLSGVSPGAVLALLPDALSPTQAALGHMAVVSVGSERADLAPVAHSGRPALSKDQLRPGQFLRLVSNPLQFDLRVAWDRSSCPADCPLAEVISRLKQRGVPGVAAVWAERSAEADIVLRLQGQRVVFAPPTHAGPDSDPLKPLPGVPAVEAGRPLSPDALAEKVAAGLHLVARARNIMRVAADLLARSAGPGLEVELRLNGGGSGGAAAIPAAVKPLLRAGDCLTLTLRNRSSLPVDVTVLYFDADHGVKSLYPSRTGETNRIDPGGSKVIADIDIHAPPAGQEYLMVIGAEASRQQDQRDYSFLEQAAVSRLRSNAAAEPDAFADAAFADHRARGEARPAAPPARTAVHVYALEVRP